MVTTQRIHKNEMGNRGSKSVFNFLISVKEQRVDDSNSVLYSYSGLRYTLMGFERNCQIINPSNQLKKKIIFYYYGKRNKYKRKRPFLAARYKY